MPSGPPPPPWSEPALPASHLGVGPTFCLEFQVILFHVCWFQNGLVGL